MSDLMSLAESCARQIRAWADSLQNSDIGGQRKLTDKSRAAYDSKRRADAFFRKIDDVFRQRTASEAGPSEDPSPSDR